MATGDTASDPFSRSGAKRGEEGSLTFKGTARSWPARSSHAANIAKEHGRAPGQDAQEVRPSTAPMTDKVKKTRHLRA
jgi:hypothetical protein